MEKILVNIYVPVLKKSYDMFIPADSPLHEVLDLIKKAVTELSDGLYFPDRNTALCRREDGQIFNINMLVFELGIQNGSRLMLI